MRGTRWLLILAILAILAGLAATYRLQKRILLSQASAKPAKMSAELKSASEDWVYVKSEDGKLIPKVTKTRRDADDGSTARFSRSIVNRCLNTKQSFLSEDATTDSKFALSQSRPASNWSTTIANPPLMSSAFVALPERSFFRSFGVLMVSMNFAAPMMSTSISIWCTFQ